MNVNAKGEWRQDVVTRSFESRCETSTFHNNVSINRTLRDMSFTVCEKKTYMYVYF